MNQSRWLEAMRGGCTLGAAMDMQVNWKGGGGKSTSTSTPVQSAQNSNLLNKSDAWLNAGGFDKNYGGSAGFDPVANMTQGQQSGITGMGNTGSSLANLYAGQGQESLDAYLGKYDPNATGVNDAISNANQQSQYDFETGQMGNIRQGATDAGQFGSSRAGIAEGLARGQLARSQATNAANMTYQDQQQFNNNRLNTLNNLSSITKGLGSGSALEYDAGALDQQQQQKELQGQLEKWGYENNVNANDLLAYKQMISGDMGGTTVSKAPKTGGSGIGSALGAVGGFALGNMIAPGVGGMAGMQAGSALGGGILG
jgi:hypothetical protein